MATAPLPRPKTATKKKAAAPKPAAQSRAVIIRTFKEHIQSRALSESSLKVANRYKGAIMEWLAKYGEADDEGHRYLYLDEPMENPLLTNSGNARPAITALKREKRGGSPVLNEDKVEALLKKKKIDLAEVEEVIPEQRVISEDKVLGLAFAKTLTDAELQSCYDESDPTYAFVLVT